MMQNASDKSIRDKTLASSLYTPTVYFFLVPSLLISCSPYLRYTSVAGNKQKYTGNPASSGVKGTGKPTLLASRTCSPRAPLRPRCPRRRRRTARGGCSAARGAARRARGRSAGCVTGTFKCKARARDAGASRRVRSYTCGTYNRRGAHASVRATTQRTTKAPRQLSPPSSAAKTCPLFRRARSCGGSTRTKGGASLGVIGLVIRIGARNWAAGPP